jgi:hypothetical protein
MNDALQTPGRLFYQDQIALLKEKRTDELVETHYHEDAALITFENVVRGRPALCEFFQKYRAGLGDFEILSLDRFVETVDAVFFEATVKSAYGIVRVYDAFALRDGKATHHFAGKHTH